MLELVVVMEEDKFDDSSSKFLPGWSQTFRFEHSLVSVSKWESFTEKPFLSKDDKTREEIQAYIRMMCLDDFPPGVFSRFTAQHYDAVNAYINAKMSATSITERPGSAMSREIITSELIYYWMVAHNIPFECETWHLNRLLMLIKVCNHKNRPAKKMSRTEAAQQRHSLNQQRRAAMGTKG